MKPQRRLLIVGCIIASMAAFGLGAWVGYSRGVRTTRKAWVEDAVYNSVYYYQQLESGGIEKAKAACGQRVWSYTDAYDRAFSDSIHPAYLKKSFSEARRIVGVVSNADHQRLIGNLDPEARRLLGEMNPAWNELVETNGAK
jgi:hypothetical protein